MNKGLVARCILSLIQPSVYAVAGRLFVLTNGRAGSKLYKPNVNTFYETGLVTSLYEHLLMDPRLAHLEIHHEMPYPSGMGAPERVDLWIRPPMGGYAHIIEAGDYEPAKVHRDLAKAKRLNPRGSNWFLAFFRDPNAAVGPWSKVSTSFARRNSGLDATQCNTASRFCNGFTVYRPDGNSDQFGYALFRAV